MPVSAWFLLAIAGWFVALSGMVLHSRRLAEMRRGDVSVDTQGWCIARGIITAVPPGLAPRTGCTGQVLFGVVAPDRVWFLRQQAGGGFHILGPFLGVLRLRDDMAAYEVRAGLGAVAMLVGMAIFLLSAIVLAAGGAGWLTASGGAMVGAIAIQVRSERRRAPMVAAEVVRALHTMNEQTLLSTDGFVSDEAGHVAALVRSRYAPYFHRLAALNRVLTTAQYRIEARPDSAQQLTCSVLFVRALAHCQATLLLLERGMRPSARALLRCALEAVFNLGACASDHKVALAFVDSHHVDRRQLGKKLTQLSSPDTKAQFQTDFDDIMRAINEEIAAVGASERRTRSMAKAAGLEDVYLLHYSLLSGPIHSTVGDLDRQFRTNPTTGHLELLTEPEIENLNDELELLSAVMAGLAAPMDKVFHLGLEGICDAHHAAIIDLNRSDG